MASTINASTSGAGGLVSTADSSGVLTLQAGGNTVVNFTNTGGTAPRITGDMSNATASNRVAFQSSTTNGNTTVYAISNGTSTQSGFLAFAGSDPNNSPYIAAISNASNAYIGSAANGTGTFLPLAFQTNNTTQMSIAVDGTITGTKGNLQLISGTAVASTSGTSIDFTGIPSWVKRITVMFNGVSTSGSSITIVQLGAGSVTTTGYFGTTNQIGSGAATTSSTIGFPFYNAGSTAILSGSIVFTTLGSNVWVGNGNTTISTANNTLTAGNITLGGTLDRVRITNTNGTDTFDAGSINIMYE